MKKAKDKKARGKRSARTVEVSERPGDTNGTDSFDTREHDTAEAPSTAESASSSEVDAAGEVKPCQEPAEPLDPIEALEARVEELTDKLARARADHQNAHRRNAIERAQVIRYANAEAMKSLLGILDDFDRSLTAADSSDNLQAVIEGVRLVHQNLTKALRDHGLERIAALHEPFDPEVHEALMQQPSTEFPSGTVISEVAKGYRLHDRVLRPSKVIVSKEPDGEEAQKQDVDDAPA